MAEINIELSPEEYVKSVLSNVLSIEKQNKSGYQKDKGKPNYTPIYCKSVEFCEKIEVHSKIGEIPEELLKKRAPNQTDKEFEYIKANYKQITLPVFNDYMSTVNRMWNDGNWDIKYAEDAPIFKEETFQEYVEKQIFIYGSIESYFKTIVATQKAIDANGVLAIKPRKNEVLENELVDPIPFIYCSESVLAFEEGEYYLFETDDKTWVEYGNTKVKDGRVFEYYDKNNIWRIEQVGKKVDNKFEIYLYYQHNLGQLPCFKLKGIPTVEDGNILHQSPFLYAVDILDDVILDSTYLRASKAKCVFPYQYMIGDVCEFESKDGAKCIGGRILGDNQEMISCPDCGGSGLKSRISPLGTLLMRPSDKFGENDGGISGAPMGYVAPSTETLEFLKTSIIEGLQSARFVLNMKKSTSTISVSGGNKTATEDINDNKAMYAFIQNISNQTFELFENVLNVIGQMRYGDKFQAPQITYPKTFDFRTEQDYTDEIANAIENGLPDIAIYSLIYSYINTRFSSQKETIEIFTLILAADRLALSSNDDVAIMKANNTAATWQVILHNSAISFIQELMMKDPKFLEQEMEAKISQLRDFAKAEANAITPEFGAQKTLSAVA